MIDFDEIARITEALLAESKMVEEALERDPTNQENITWCRDLIARHKAWQKHARALLKMAELEFLHSDSPSMALH